MANVKPLNGKQVEILRWIADGCPDGRYDDGFAHRIVARALEGRGLVAIKGRGASWQAEITAAGTERLRALGSPDPEFEESEADELWSRVIAAGGSIKVDIENDQINYEKLIRLSMSSPARPFAKKLLASKMNYWDANVGVVSIVDHFPDRVEPRPVRMPGAVKTYHPVVQAFLKDKEWQLVSKEQVTRAAHVLQALAAEGENRGLQVLDPRAAVKHLPAYEQRKVAGTHLTLIVAEGTYTVKVREIPGKGAAKMKPRYWNEPKRLPAWQESRGWEFIPTGKLELKVDGPGTAYGGDVYRDAKSRRVEDLLPEVFRSIEIYALMAQRRREEKERAAASRQVRWEEAMKVAKESYREHHRSEALQSQFQYWQRANAMELFIGEMDRAVEAMEDGEGRSRALEWRDWSAAQVVKINPLLQPLQMPETPEPKAEDLRPFLGGWSPYGPDQR